MKRCRWVIFSLLAFACSSETPGAGAGGTGVGGTGAGGTGAGGLAGPGVTDGPRIDGPRHDGPFFPPDAPIVRNDAGVYLCTDALGQRPCACNDGVDNDMDGKIDSVDPDCSQPWDDTENPTVFGTTQCTDGIDNDGDGRIDGADPECVSSLDNDESSFATGIPGDNRDACKQDCFFDGDSGAGNDGCNWDLHCDMDGGLVGCPYRPSPRCSDPQNATCQRFCLQFTPNGCDCFGCCTIFDPQGVPHDVRLSSMCSVARVNDRAACPPCAKVPSCDNPCGRCELCLGRDPASLPADCGSGSGSGGSGGAAGGGMGSGGSGGAAGDGGGSGLRCPGTQVPCGPGGVDPSRCPADTFCVTGCCIPTIG